MAYPDPYPQRPAPDQFVRRWLFITTCVAALMLFWQFLPAIEAWFSPREAAERTVTPRGDLAARLTSAAEAEGLLLLRCGTEGQIVRWLPPLTVSSAEIDEAVARFARAAQQVAA